MKLIANKKQVYLKFDTLRLPSMSLVNKYRTLKLLNGTFIFKKKIAPIIIKSEFLG